MPPAGRLGAVQRVGVFGGAFDPPHQAHRALAEAALSELRLDRLHVLPTGRAWHKARSLTDIAHRVAMCQGVFGDLPGVRIDGREALRDGPTYTVDTLAELAGEYPGAALFLVIGGDQLAAFKTWKRWQEVLGMATLVVAGRAASSAPSGLSDSRPAEPPAPVDIPFTRLHTPLLAVSATAVRALVASGQGSPHELAALVPEAVASYISQHSLYQKPS